MVVHTSARHRRSPIGSAFVLTNATVADVLRRIASTIVPAPVDETSARPGAYPLMDSIRALAALSIFLYHCSTELSLGSTGDGLAQTLVVGVPIFFVVSGFLLYRPFALAHLRDGGSPPFRAYAWRRLLRIVPAFWAALIVILLLGDQVVRAADLPLLFAFAQVYDPATASLGIGQAWSLDNEIVYYALIPLVAMGLRSWRAASVRGRLALELAGLAVLLAVAVAYKAWALGWGDQTSLVGQVFLLHPGWNLDLFLLGMGLAVWSAYRQVSDHVAPLPAVAGGRPGLLWVGAATTFVLIGVQREQIASDAGLLVIHAAQGLCAGLIVMPAISTGAITGALRRRVLANRALLSLGVLSYGFYLWHLTVVRAAFGLNGPLEALPPAAAASVQIGIAFLGTVVLAAVSWVVVERPALSLKRLVGRPAPIGERVAPAGERAVPAGVER